MARKSPLDRLKDAAAGTLKDPLGTATKAFGHVRGTVAVGRTLAAHTVSAVVARMPGHGSTAPAPAVPPAPARKPERRPAVASPSVPEPEAVVTEIDRAAEVDATPADLAKLMAKKAPAARKPATSTKTAATARKAAARPAPTKANTPGAKLPPRRVVPDAGAEQAD